MGERTSEQRSDSSPMLVADHCLFRYSVDDPMSEMGRNAITCFACELGKEGGVAGEDIMAGLEGNAGDSTDTGDVGVQSFGAPIGERTNDETVCGLMDGAREIGGGACQ